MTTYTAVADANGDFIVPFSSNYTSGQKITVTAEKDGAIKEIELFAPSDPIGGGVIQFSGNMSNFPANIGNITLKSDVAGQIGNYAFNAVDGVGGNLFSKAKGLSIEGGVTNIGVGAFKDWNSSEFLNILSTSLLVVNNSAFINWNKCTVINIPAGITTIGNSAFQGWSEFTSILNLPASINSIGSFAFSGWTKALGVVLPLNLTTIAASSFSSWSAALSLNIPNGVSAIQQQAFISWSAATSLTLPDTLISVGNSAFWGWNKLLSLTIPTSVATLEAGAFENMSSCNEIICMRATPPSAVASTFNGLKATCVIKVPTTALAAYQAAAGWSVHAAKMIGV